MWPRPLVFADGLPAPSAPPPHPERPKTPPRSGSSFPVLLALSPWLLSPLRGAVSLPFTFTLPRAFTPGCLEPPTPESRTFPPGCLFQRCPQIGSLIHGPLHLHPSTFSSPNHPLFPIFPVPPNRYSPSPSGDSDHWVVTLLTNREFQSNWGQPSCEHSVLWVEGFSARGCLLAEE